MSEQHSNQSDKKPENAIDIFVFSNGEQNAPPRKYHLELKEINMWKGTLRNLGNSHYGIHNADIDMYTTDGRKVEGPTELGHLKAYVAVIPPCAFIQAGYDNYLIKASRSWEKRLLKITNSIESSAKDQKRKVLPKSEINIKIIESEAQKLKEIEEDIKGTNDNRAKVIANSVQAKKLQECSKVTKCLIGTKQTRKPSLTNESTTLKTQIFTPFKIPSTARRSVVKAKESLQIKPTGPRKGFPIALKRNTLKAPCCNNDCNKLVGKNIKHTVITSLNVSAKKSDNKFRSSLTPKTIQTQDFGTKDSVSNDETKYYKNNDTDIPSVSTAKFDEILNERYKNTLQNEVVSISDKSGNNTSTMHVQRVSSKSSMTNSENKKEVQCLPHCPMGKEPVLVCKPSLVTCINCIPRQGQMDNFVAIVNNDKLIKLQLNLEIENGAISVKNENDVKSRHSIKSILKEEKEIQVNMYEESNVVNEQIHAHFPKSDVIKNPSEEAKIIIIHCSCLNDIDLNYLLQSYISQNQMCQREVTPDLNSGVKNFEETRCECEILSPKVDPVENLTTNEATNALIVTKVSEQKVITSEVEFVKCISTVKNEMVRPREISTVAKPEDNKIDMFISRSTQTNWCSIILQAVRRDGGGYSLRLPPLFTVKNMSDCCE